MAAGDRDGAADALLEIIRRDREWNDGAARKRFLQLLEAQGLEDPWSSAQRRRLSARAVHMSRTLRVPHLPAARRDPVPALAAAAAHLRAALSRDGPRRDRRRRPDRDDPAAPARRRQPGAALRGRLRRRDRRGRGARRRPLQHRAARVQPLPADCAKSTIDAALSLRRGRHRGVRRRRAASRSRWSSAPRSSAKRAGSATRWAWRSTGTRSAGSTTRCWSMPSPRSRRSTSAPSRRCSSRRRSTSRADLLVQLMQFHRVAVTGGVEIEPTLQ